ncbi:MAG: hypothetical protein H7320_11550 [Ferruginibacter sp.]|nr:hypothetical protein [Ferruginibacter sp.]
MIKHITSAQVDICFTREYKLFKFLPGNRPLNNLKIKKIIAEIDNGNDMLMYYPIQVKEKDGSLWILDGQHRFTISKFFQRNIFYIIVQENKTMAEIAKVNSNVEKWSMENFMACYREQGNNHYQKLTDFVEKYPFGIGCALNLLSTGNPGVEGYSKDLNESFKNGIYEVKELEAATELAEKCKLFSDSDLWKSKSFIIAIYRIWKAEKITIEELHAAYLKYPHMLTRQANYKGYVVAFEQIVNNKKHNRTVIL